MLLRHTFAQKFLTALVASFLFVTISFSQITPQNSFLAAKKKNPEDKTKSIAVQAIAEQGKALIGNSDSANLLILVTDSETGEPVNNLTIDNFRVKNHFSIKGKRCACSEIKSLATTAQGAYRVKLGFSSKKTDCFWQPGSYLLQIMVKDSESQGQTATTLNIK